VQTCALPISVLHMRLVGRSIQPVSNSFVLQRYCSFCWATLVVLAVASWLCAVMPVSKVPQISQLCSIFCLATCLCQLPPWKPSMIIWAAPLRRGKKVSGRMLTLTVLVCSKHGGVMLRQKITTGHTTIGNG